MTSFWSRRKALAAEGTRRIVVTGSLIAALLAASALLAGSGFAASHVTPASAVAPVGHVAASPPPSPAGDQYGAPPGFKSKCTLKANAVYKTAVAKAKKALAAKLKLCTTSACKTLALKQYKAALAAAKLKQKKTVGTC